MWVYVLLIGSPMTALRAAVTNSIAYFGWQLGFRSRFFNTVGLAALVLLFGWPRMARTAGFQFSFLALIAIGTYLNGVGPRVRALLRGIGQVWQKQISTDIAADANSSRKLRFATEQFLDRWRESNLIPVGRSTIRGLQYPLHWCCLSLMIQILTLPLALFYGNRLCWVQVPANLLLGPLFSLILMLIFLSFLTFWTPFGGIFFLLLEGLGRIWLILISALSTWGLETWLPHPSAAGTLLWVALIGCVIWTSRWTILPGLLLASLMTGTLLWTSDPYLEGRLSVTVLDVGQGDCLHIRYPDGTNSLVDTGGLVFSDDPDYLARSVVARYLWQEGVRRLRSLILSHNHLDHVQGTEFLTRAFSVEELWIGPRHPTDSLPGQISLRRLARQDDFEIAGVRHRVLHPPPWVQGRASTNQQSVVLELSFGDHRILLPGDIGELEERQLRADGRSVTLLKVPHHGSARSNSIEFLEAFPAKVTVVSAGRHNPFGHPAPTAVGRFAILGIPLLRTAEWGAIRWQTDGHSWTIQNYAKGKWSLR